MLGTGESGKSTVFKQMRIINSTGYSAGELKQYPAMQNYSFAPGPFEGVRCADPGELLDPEKGLPPPKKELAIT